jgi:glycine/D-amino acid oxidase-like deaminating enzyme
LSAPITAATPPEHADPPPARVRVVVIGGGVIGVMAAWHLARRGLSVALCEKGVVAGEQSSRNWGWIRQQGRDPAELPIMIESSRMWDDLPAQAGADLGFRRTGVLYLARSEKDQAAHERWMEHARAHQLDTRLLTAQQVADMIPLATAGKWIGGLWTASDGRAEPALAVPALARALARSGATVHEHCAVRALDITAGRVAGVVTERGRIACDAVVLAGGAWSSLLARAHGVEIPQLSVRATVAATEPLPEIFAGNAADSDFAFRRRLDGGYTIAAGGFHELFLGPDAFRRFGKFVPQLRADPFGTRCLPAAPRGYPDGWFTPRRWSPDAPSPFEAMRVLDPRPNRGAVDRTRRRFAAAFPQLGLPAIRTAWAGMIDTMPDIVPVVDHAPLPGLVIATGMSGHGFGIGPGIGRVVADLVTGRAPGHDLTRFRFGRFTDGSPIELGGAL